MFADTSRSSTGGRAPRILLLAPSQGLGGGIERYVKTLEWALSEGSVEYDRINLRRPGTMAHAQLLAQARATLRNTHATHVVAAHRSLLPAASLLAAGSPVPALSVLCYGMEAWGKPSNLRGRIELRLMRGPRVRLVAISSYTAGAISPIGPATVLPPALAPGWFQALDAAALASQKLEKADGTFRIATSFRLADWCEKGLPEIVEAMASLGRSDVSLTVCGSGEPPSGLLRLIRDHPFCALRQDLTDRALAKEFAAADLFILASRTRFGAGAYGEGFGLVLLEAQVAGTPVVAPAYGGSRDAYVDGITGLTPQDESAAALARVVESLIDNPGRVAEMSKVAREWARDYFAPHHYPRLVASALL